MGDAVVRMASPLALFGEVSILGILDQRPAQITLNRANELAAAICAISGAAPDEDNFHAPFTGLAAVTPRLLRSENRGAQEFKRPYPQVKEINRRSRPAARIRNDRKYAR